RVEPRRIESLANPRLDGGETAQGDGWFCSGDSPADFRNRHFRRTAGPSYYAAVSEHELTVRNVNRRDRFGAQPAVARVANHAHNLPGESSVKSGDNAPPERIFVREELPGEGLVYDRHGVRRSRVGGRKVSSVGESYARGLKIVLACDLKICT